MVHTLSILVLVAVFTVATLTPVNMGILAFVAAFLVGTVSGVTLEDVLGYFPGDTFVLVVGITLLFGVAKVNGTIDLVVAASLRLVKGRRWAIVWLMFGLAAVLMSLGSVLAVGMLAPIAMPIAARYRINPLLMGMMLSHGALSTAFSPITVYGAFSSELVSDAGINLSPLLMFVVPFAFNVVIAAVLFLVLGRDLFKGGPDDRVELPGPQEPTGAGGAVGTIAPPRASQAVEVTPMRLLTLTGMLALLVLGAFGLDVGVAAFVVATALLLLAPNGHKSSGEHIAWPAVLLVCGMLSYMAVLQENGTLDLLGDAAVALGSPVLAALLLCLSVAIVSAFGSSIGTLGIALPLAFPLLAGGEIGAVGFIVALGFCSTVVDVSPFSTNGVIVLAQAQVPDKRRFQRQMLGYTGLVVVGAPLLSWAVAILPSSL
ncbi:SLC13 family permease [Prauserella flavalba]|uniref:C4-dicarboxylate ABC transporter n=1 Tax=Prauserella flavalba TaxID=1477506 RepID=A0A318LXA9_9PSEU|nr:SLC13 family permease [Prauserella flavalba]PXY37358.1 C4-dicarboxylate ABC transporter [Prauserella flavalba]